MPQTPPREPEITLLFDGGCPLCAREALFLERLDKGRGRIALVDIVHPDFDASRYGLTQEQVMGAMHGVTHDGEIVVGMGVFRQAYQAVGWGWLLAPTAWPLLRPLFDAFYRWFAKRRLTISKAVGGCVGGTCRVPSATPGRQG